MLLRSPRLLWIFVASSYLLICGAQSAKEKDAPTDLDSNPLVGDGIDREEALALRQSPFRLATSNGISISGTVEATEGDNVFYAFRGIRYARPPIGSKRFERPQVSLDDWNQWDHFSDGPACPQTSQKQGLEISEDCLWLNVFTPELSHLENPSLEAKYDVAGGFLHEHKFSKHGVLVFFHPAGRNWNSGWAGDDDYGPTHLLDYEVLLVTVNYRIGALGFLEDNLGLRDQSAALDWIRANIDTFGGDNSRITLIGHGSGAAATHLHALSPLSRGKFNSVISMSGAATSPWAIATNFQKNKKELESRCPGKTCLMDSSVEKLVELSKDLEFGPVIDGDFIVSDPRSVMKSGKFHNGSWLVGLTNDEGRALASRIFEKGTTTTDPKSILGYVPKNWEKIRREYLGSGSAEITLSKLNRLVSDAVFNIGVDESVRYMSQYSDGAVYYYRLNQPNVTLDRMNVSLSHGEELPYLFPMVLNHPEPDDENQLFRKIFLRMLSDFVCFGHPTKSPWNRQHLHHTYWRHYQPNKRQYIDLTNSKIQMKVNLFDKQFKFWNSLNNARDEL